MPKDYALNSGSPEGRRELLKKLGKLGLVAFFIVMLGLGARFLYVNVDFATLEEKAIATLPSHQTNTPSKMASAPTPKTQPKFEFYTMLPNGGIAKLHPLHEQAHTLNPQKALTASKSVKKTELALKHAKSQALSNTKNPTTIKKTPVLAHQKIAPKATIPAKPIKKPRHLAAATKSIKLSTKKPIKDSSGQFLLQVGSFKQFEDAHKLKGRLLLEGYTVTISTFTNESTTWHRVMVGPYHSLTQAKKAQDMLEEANLNCLLKRIA